MTPEPDDLIGEIRKNSRQTLRVGLLNLHGQNVCIIRYYRTDEQGEPVPQRHYVTVRLSMLDKLIENLVDARQRARLMGMR